MTYLLFLPTIPNTSSSLTSLDPNSNNHAHDTYLSRTLSTLPDTTLPHASFGTLSPVTLPYRNLCHILLSTFFYPDGIKLSIDLPISPTDSTTSHIVLVHTSNTNTYLLSHLHQLPSSSNTHSMLLRG